MSEQEIDNPGAEVLREAAAQMREDWQGAFPSDGNESYTWQFVAGWLESEAVRVGACMSNRQAILEKVPSLAAAGWTAPEAQPSPAALAVAHAYLGHHPVTGYITMSGAT